MEKSLFQQIEEVLNELLSVMSEEDYVKFIEDDELLNIYDKVALLDNPEGILTDEVLTKILNLVNAKLGVTSSSSGRYYTVVKGDTLWAIAKRYYGDGNRYPEIARANNIANPNIIHIGQKLLIP